MLPIDLPNGVVVVYGMGTKVSPSGITLISEQSPVRFGYIHQVYNGAVAVYDGDSVMFMENQIVGRIMYLDYPYTLVPARLVTKEQPLL